MISENKRGNSGGRRSFLFIAAVAALLLALAQVRPFPALPEKVSVKPGWTAVAQAGPRQAPQETPEATKKQVLKAYGRVTLSFEANQGQAELEKLSMSKPGSI